MKSKRTKFQKYEEQKDHSFSLSPLYLSPKETNEKNINLNPKRISGFIPIGHLLQDNT